jgi:hypothetical protein
MWNGLLLVLFIFCKGYSVVAFDAVYAVNFGNWNVTYIDSQGVEYKNYTGECKFRESTSTIYRNVPDDAQTLYQHYCREEDKRLTIPLSGDGKYLLILKLTPYSPIPTASLKLNNNHMIWRFFSVSATIGADDLAYDEYILFSVCGNRLKYKTEVSSIVRSRISLYFRNEPDYINIAALVLYKGDVHNFKVQPTIAKNFNSNDFVHQSKFECRGNSFFETTTTKATTTTESSTTTSTTEPTTTTVTISTTKPTTTTSTTATTSTTEPSATISTTVKPCTVNNNYYFMNFIINKIPSKEENLPVDEI